MRPGPILLVTVAMSVASVAAAQSTVGGVVTDSLARAPLAGAVVQLVSADSVGRFGASTTSDSLGRFSVAAVPRGRYMLGFFHPVLDSLGIEAPLREVRVDRDGATLRADVAVPGAGRLRATICGAKTARDSTLGVVVGTVRGASDGAPVTGADVVVEWLEYSLGTGGLTRHVGRLKATTGDNGWFALCGGPSAGSVAVLASRGADSTDRFELVMPEGGFARRELYLGAATTVAISDSATMAVPTATAPGSDTSSLSAVVRTHSVRTGDVRIGGVVVTAVGSKPLAGAQVAIVGGPQTVANDSGAWTIGDAPAGTRTIEIHAVGYYPERRAVDVIPGAPPVRVALRTLQAVLDTVRVTASGLRGAPPAEFMQRRKSAFGHFITADDLEHIHALTTSDIFKNQPGVQLYRDTNGVRRLRMRGVISKNAFGAGDYDPYCEPTVFLDGHQFANLSIDEISTMVHPDDIVGIEIYDESTVPPQYQDFYKGFPCGSVVIWTKSHPKP